MTRVSRIWIVAVAAALAAPAAASASAQADLGWSRAPAAKSGVNAPPFAARLTACRRSLRPEGRSAVVAATMRPIEGAKRFAVKVELFERAFGPAGHWTLRDDVPGLGTWTTPADTTLGTRAADVYKYRQAVARLVAQYAYRFRVGFRWLDADGAVVREATATTRPCRQPDLRPDLAVVRVRARASARFPGLVRYVVLVRNDGRSTARGVFVGATLPGDVEGTDRRVRLGRIAPGETAEAVFSGPGCAAGDPAAPSFLADPANVVDELDEADNGFGLACPVP